MRKSVWYSLKRGDVIAGEGGRPRTIIKAGNGFVTLRKISFATHRLWSGHYRSARAGNTTVYVTCDCKQFTLVRRADEH